MVIMNLMLITKQWQHGNSALWFTNYNKTIENGIILIHYTYSLSSILTILFRIFTSKIHYHNTLITDSSDKWVPAESAVWL